MRVNYKYKQIIVIAASLIASIILLFHFFIIFMGNIPGNYITSKIEEQIMEYKNGVFFQDWHLFAPNPVSFNDFLYAQAELEDGNKTPWVNISKSLISEMQRNRLSPKYVEQIMIANGILRVQVNDDEAEEMIKNYSKYFVEKNYNKKISKLHVKITRGMFEDFYKFNYEKIKHEETIVLYDSKILIVRED